ncbi:MAG TPA: hypothetical protein VII99_07280 [Bacteroidia bacterium]
MKKTIIATCLSMLVGFSAFAQPVSDRAVIPIGVTLVQILRIHITNGGNIEFVFNDLNDYTNGIANGALGIYNTDVEIASSTNWTLHFGAEDATLKGTENPANTLPLDNVGFQIAWNGVGTTCGIAAAANNATTAGGPYISTITPVSCGLKVFTNTGAVMTDVLLSAGALGNGGDITKNAFQIKWECGTMVVAGATTPMHGTSILAQSPTPDRYTTNVFLDLKAN